MSMTFFLVSGQFKGRLGQSWDKRDGGFCPKLWSASTGWDKIPRPFCPKLGRAPCMTSGTPGTAARETGSVGKAGAALRQNRRPSVLTLLDSRADDGKKGFFSPETGSIGTDAPGFLRSSKARLPTVLNSRAGCWSHAYRHRCKVLLSPHLMPLLPRQTPR